MPQKRAKSFFPTPISILFALVSLLVVPAPSAADYAGTSVAGGYPPAGGAFPWVALVQGPGRECSGSLIAPRRVLTAAHCVMDDPNPRRWTVHIGSVDRNDGARAQPLTGISIHPLASAPLYGPHANHAFYDAAVLFLKDRASVAPGTLGTELDRNPLATVVGWGHQNLDHQHPVLAPSLQAAALLLGSADQCAGWADSRNQQHFMSLIHLCGYDPEGDDCVTHGDSGGPLVVSVAGGQRLIGVASFFPNRRNAWGACGYDSVVAFTRVDTLAMRDWLLTVPNPACPGAHKRFRALRRKVSSHFAPKPRRSLHRTKNDVRASCAIP